MDGSALPSVDFTGAPPLNGNAELGAEVAASGVLDKLPKPNPTGFPMLPAGLPNANGKGFTEDADADADVVDPAPKLNALVVFSEPAARPNEDPLEVPKGLVFELKAPVKAEESASPLSSFLEGAFPKKPSDDVGAILDDPNRKGEVIEVDVVEAAGWEVETMLDLPKGNAGVGVVITPDFGALS